MKTTTTTIETKHVVIVRSDGPRGRVGLVAQHYVNRQPDSDTPFVGRLNGKMVPVTFREANDPIDGVQRRFWATSVPGEVFRELLWDGYVAEPHGSLSAFTIAQSTPETRALVNRAIDHVAAALREGQESDSS